MLAAETAAEAEAELALAEVRLSLMIGIRKQKQHIILCRTQKAAQDAEDTESGDEAGTPPYAWKSSFVFD